MEDKLQILQATLAMATQNIKAFHWNMKGKGFISAHKLFDEAYERFNEFVDEVAEKLIMRGERSLNKYSEYINKSLIEEIGNVEIPMQQIWKQSIGYFDKVENAANKLQDSHFAIQPLLDEIYLFVDKYRWFFRAHII